MADTHTVMPKKLAHALMEAGMQHFDAGGIVGALGVGNNFQATGVSQPTIQTQAGNQANVYGQQQDLASQLLAQTQGGGPGNALVAQRGAQQIAGQGATMASARGASANPAAIARQAAIQGQQGQQQVLNAQAGLQMQSQNALAQQQAQMANQSIQTQGILYGANTAAEGINAQVAGQNAGANQGILGGVIGGAAGALGLAHGGQVPQKMAVGGQVGGMGMQNYMVPQLGLGQAQSTPFGSMLAGGMKAGGGLNKVLGAPGAPQGDGSGFSNDQMSQMSDRYQAAQAGGIPMADPGVVPPSPAGAPAQAGGSVAPGSGQYAPMPQGMDPFQGIGPSYQVGQPNPDFMSQGGQIPFRQMLSGGGVPGKAQVKGDSEKNDNVPTMLSPGEEVIDKETMQDPGPVGKAARMVAEHIKAKNKKSGNEPKTAEFLGHLKSKKKGGYSKVAEARKAK